LILEFDDNPINRSDDYIVEAQEVAPQALCKKNEKGVPFTGTVPDQRGYGYGHKCL
jgi:hypothetical protein